MGKMAFKCLSAIVDTVHERPHVIGSLFFPSAQVVTAHGICHLLGYRHETQEEWTEVCMEISPAKKKRL